MTELEDLFAEREDLKSQRQVIAKNSRDMADELTRLFKIHHRSYSRKAAEYTELRRINGEAIKQIDARLTAISTRVKELRPISFPQKFVEIARECLDAATYEMIEKRTREVMTHA